MEKHTQTKPHMFQVGSSARTDLLIGDPSITIIEAGRSVGLLLAETCFENTLGDLFMEQATWIRRTPWRSLTVRALGKVALYRHESGYYVAQDTETGKLLPCPSQAAYWVISLSEALYRHLLRSIERETFRQFAEALRPRVSQLPGFALHGERLSAPPHYADRVPAQLEQAILRG
jgi:hypothetical protein